MAKIKNLKEDFENLFKLFKQNVYHNVIIIPHRNPDFDALGSAVGLFELTKAFKINSQIVVDVPTDPGAQMVLEEFKSKKINIISADEYQKGEGQDLFLLTDVNSIDKKRIPIDIQKENKEHIYAIDHHDLTANGGVSPRNRYIDKESSSASEIVAKLLNQFDVKYRICIAKYLLLGIYLDTNQLRKQKGKDTLSIVALLQRRVKEEEINKYFKKDFLVARKIYLLVASAEFIDEQIGIMTGDDLEIFKDSELGMAADKLLQYAEVTFAIGRVAEDMVHISARASGVLNDQVNISQVMSRLGGGGQRNSAAAKLENISTEEAAKILKKELCPEFAHN